MKDMKYYLRFIVLMLCVSFVACDDDDKEATPIFPELQKIECAVGEKQTLTFDATSDWTLTSSALWCKFVVDGEDAFTCSGTAGQQSVTIRIDDDATELMKSYKAELSLMTGGAQQVIFTVTRPVTGEELHVFDQTQMVEYTFENPLPKSYEKYVWNEGQRIVVSANVDWIVEWSDELGCENAKPNTSTTFTPSGEAGETVTLKLSLKEGYTKKVWEGSLKFRNKKNEIFYTLPVKYDGIPADKLESTYEQMKDRDVVFSHDRWTYTWNNETKDAPMPITVIARNAEYVKVYVDYTKVQDPISWELEYTCTTMTESDSWFFADEEDLENPGDLSLMALENRGKERTGYLMVFPQEVYNRIESNFDEIVFSTEEGIVSDYMEYLVTSIKQSGDPSATGGFVVTNGMGEPLLDEYGDKIEAMYDNNMPPAKLEETYGTSNVFTLGLPESQNYNAINVTPSGFTGYFFEMNTMFGEEDTLIGWDGVGFEPAGSYFMITGLGIGVKGSQEIVFTIIDPSEGNVFGVLKVSRY